MFCFHTIRLSLQCRRLSRRLYTSTLPEFDMNYYCNKDNYFEIKENINKRKGVGDINKVLLTYESFNNTCESDKSYNKLREELYQELFRLPNKTHPDVLKYPDEPQLIKTINNKKEFNVKALEFSEITKYLNIMRTDRLGYTCGNKSYYFIDELAELEEALIKYAVTTLLKKNFKLISVPDILLSSVLESCGMTINNERTQV